MTLKELGIGQSARILTVGGEGALRQHFLDMGVRPDAGSGIQRRTARARRGAVHRAAKARPALPLRRQDRGKRGR